ncbi:MAG: ComEC/Rec2 family competence protein [Ilumatobacteraceae bacterium]
MRAAYGAGGGRWWQPVSDLQMGGLALAAVVGVWAGTSWWVTTGAVMCVAVAVAGRAGRRDLVVAAAVLVVAGGLAADRSWREVVPRALGPFSGWAVVVTDPQPVGAGSSIVLEVEGQRFQSYVYGSERRRLSTRRAGELVQVSGRRVPLRAETGRRSQVRHVVGQLQLDAVIDHAPGTPLMTGANRLRARLASGASAVMAPEDAALFSGLVIGDDTQQPRTMIDQFRSAGLSHLTAVSGQNVGFVLAVVGVGLRRLRPWWRLGATWAVIAWFVVLTRVEPSVVRAGTMAALSALAFALGRERSVARLLAVTVMGLVLIDPMLVWSVGFWLSVTATAGVCVVGPWLEPRLGGPVWLAAPLAVTLGAQAGVMVPSWLVFGRMPSLGIISNLLAVPVAGVVMLYGIPAALVASVTPGWFASMVMLPASLGTRWVRTVAALGARLEPQGTVAVFAWVVQVVAIAALLVAGRARR